MPLYFWFITIHILSLVVGMGAVIVIDTFGTLWLFKKVSLRYVMSVADVTQRLIWVGWSGLVVSGTGLLVLKGFIDNLTWMKLFFVALVGANGVLMHVVKKSLEALPNETVPARLRFRIALTSVISQVGWWSAITIGLLHNEWQSYIGWPSNPELYMASILALILVIAGIGEIAFRRASRS